MPSPKRKSFKKTSATTTVVRPIRPYRIMIRLSDKEKTILAKVAKDVNLPIAMALRKLTQDHWETMQDRAEPMAR